MTRTAFSFFKAKPVAALCAGFADDTEAARSQAALVLGRVADQALVATEHHALAASCSATASSCDAKTIATFVVAVAEEANPIAVQAALVGQEAWQASRTAFYKTFPTSVRTTLAFRHAETATTLCIRSAEDSTTLRAHAARTSYVRSVNVVVVVVVAAAVVAHSELFVAAAVSLLCFGWWL